ncbi:MAG: exopolysaccharide biosynthesis polyprenyl glycosylphosphotransferase [Acidobacteria bacterium]|nr:exopolysaccharide biosynthesis polyprenyl glycosylphosphotransferase [Acidobacteriota bacterium]
MNGFMPHTLRLRPALAVADGVLAAGAAWLAHLLRFTAAERGPKWADLTGSPGFLVCALAALWALAVAAELYEPARLRRRRDVAMRVLVVALVWSAALALATYLVPAWRFGRGLLLLTTASWGVLAAAFRLVLARWVRRRVRSLALVIGTPDAVERVCRKLSQHPLAPWEPVDGAAVPLGELAEETRRRGAELVILAGMEASAGTGAADLAALHVSGVPVVIASEVWAWLDGRLPVRELSPAAFFHQPGFGAVHWELFNQFTRVLDVTLGFVMLVLAVPLVLPALLLIAVTDGFPLFYLQWRVGQFGRSFRVVKLRTMRRDAEEDGPAFEQVNDRRVTRIGRLLRRLRVDELPQLLNVLRGDMSLVGPRPERPEFVSELARLIPYYTFRLAVPPGLTGWSQVSMPYARTLEEQQRKLEYDLYFIRERSVGLYLLILLRTLSVALTGVRR